MEELSYQDYYTRIQILGSGTFGTAMKFTRKLDGKEICIKMSNIVNDHKRKIMEKEIKNLNHPNIIEFYTCFMYQNKIGIVMELADGGNLLRKTKEVLSEYEILIILVQILNGLQYLHARHIVHLDLKPENILLTKDNEIKICDFGLSKFLEQSIVSHLTFAGTTHYISPEVYLDGPGGTPSDIWSLGVIGYYFFL
jgi:serine/threonine protein kinase